MAAPRYARLHWRTLCCQSLTQRFVGAVAAAVGASATEVPPCAITRSGGDEGTLIRATSDSFGRGVDGSVIAGFPEQRTPPCYLLLAYFTVSTSPTARLPLIITDIRPIATSACFYCISLTERRVSSSEISQSKGCCSISRAGLQSVLGPRFSAAAGLHSQPGSARV